MNSAANQGAPFYDVVVIGGALSGAATATLLLRQNSGLRILIVEKSAQLTRRVGEATVEVSAFFMGRVLGLTQYLNESHLVKQGLRFWFTNDGGEIARRSERTGRALPGPSAVISTRPRGFRRGSPTSRLRRRGRTSPPRKRDQSGAFSRWRADDRDSP